LIKHTIAEVSLIETLRDKLDSISTGKRIFNASKYMKTNIQAIRYRHKAPTSFKIPVAATYNNSNITLITEAIGILKTINLMCLTLVQFSLEMSKNPLHEATAVIAFIIENSFKEGFLCMAMHNTKPLAYEKKF